LGEFDHSKEGFFDGAYKEKGARSFGGKTKKNTKKHLSDTTRRINDVLNSIRKNNFIAE